MAVKMNAYAVLKRTQVPVASFFAGAIIQDCAGIPDLNVEVVEAVQTETRIGPSTVVCTVEAGRRLHSVLDHSRMFVNGTNGKGIDGYSYNSAGVSLLLTNKALSADMFAGAIAGFLAKAATQAPGCAPAASVIPILFSQSSNCDVSGYTGSCVVVHWGNLPQFFSGLRFHPMAQQAIWLNDPGCDQTAIK
ncbi:MAG: hypothetical protein P4L87_19685, partial [Formivibrio sp.]|nr:hypothetical protein [Formivibrio sp.]